MTIEVLGKTYDVLAILPRKRREHDLFLCKAPAGYRECFQRFDIGREGRKVVIAEQIPWTYEEILIIKNKLKQGMIPSKIANCEELKRHTPLAIENKARLVKKQMKERESKPRFNIKF